MAGNGTKHHKIHGLMGWGLIAGLIPMLVIAMGAIPNGPQGIIEWLSHRPSALVFLAFFTVAIWYCKLEFDEVIMDYFNGGLRSFGLLANRIVPFIIWLLAAYALAKLAFL